MVILIVVIALFSATFFIFGQADNPVQPAKSGEYKETFSGKLNHQIDNSYFSFDSSANWKLAKEETSAPGKFVYHSFHNGLVEKKLTIYLGNVPSNSRITYLLTVNKLNNVRITPEMLSGHCSSPAAKSIVAQSFRGINFECLNNRAQVIVAVANQEDKFAIRLKNSKGELVPVGFIYQDSTFIDPKNVSLSGLGILSQVLSSFNLK